MKSDKLVVTVVDKWKRIGGERGPGFEGLCSFERGGGLEFGYVTILLTNGARNVPPACIAIDVHTFELCYCKKGLPIPGLFRVVSIERKKL